MRLRKILCPVDFSESARVALHAATDLAKENGAALVLLHAFQPPSYIYGEGGYGVPEALGRIEEAARKDLDAWRRDAETRGLTSVEAMVVEGTAWEEIIGAAAALTADLIVMGTHGRTGIKHMVIGSVAERVVRQAPCSVLVVRLPA
jgi:nucleotide-binding universal stress UspA family protein